MDVPAAEMVGAQEVLGMGLRAIYLWRPVLDGTVLAGLPIRAIETGAAAGIPLLVGNNGREAATFAMFDRTAPARAERVLVEMFGDAGSRRRSGTPTAVGSPGSASAEHRNRHRDHE